MTSRELRVALQARERLVGAGGREHEQHAVDAGGVSFLGSAGLAVMIRYAEAIATAGRAPVLRAASDHVERLLRATGMEPYFVRPEMTSPPGQNETGSSSTP